MAVIEYSLLSLRKVVRLKPDLPDRWLRPWLHATANCAIGHLRPMCTCTRTRLDASLHTTVCNHIDFVRVKYPPADTTNSTQPQHSTRSTQVRPYQFNFMLLGPYRPKFWQMLFNNNSSI